MCRSINGRATVTAAVTRSLESFRATLRNSVPTGVGSRRIWLLSGGWEMVGRRTAAVARHSVAPDNLTSRSSARPVQAMRHMRFPC